MLDYENSNWLIYNSIFTKAMESLTNVLITKDCSCALDIVKFHKKYVRMIKHFIIWLSGKNISNYATLLNENSVK